MSNKDMQAKMNELTKKLEVANNKIMISDLLIYLADRELFVCSPSGGPVECKHLNDHISNFFDAKS